MKPEGTGDINFEGVADKISGSVFFVRLSVLMCMAIVIDFTVIVVENMTVDVNVGLVGLVGYMSAGIIVHGVGNMIYGVTTCVNVDTAFGIDTNGEGYIDIDSGARDVKYTTDDNEISSILKDDVMIGIILIAAKYSDFDTFWTLNILEAVSFGINVGLLTDAEEDKKRFEGNFVGYIFDGWQRIGVNADECAIVDIIVDISDDGVANTEMKLYHVRLAYIWLYLVTVLYLWPVAMLWLK